MSEEHKAMTLERIAVMQAYVDGKPIESREFTLTTIGPWGRSNEPTWNFSLYEYRIATTPDSINWDHVSPEWKYMARDEEGETYLYQNEPECRNLAWESSGLITHVWTLASYARGTVDWKDSLVKRPD